MAKTGREWMWQPPMEGMKIWKNSMVMSCMHPAYNMVAAATFLVQRALEPGLNPGWATNAGGD